MSRLFAASVLLSTVALEAVAVEVTFLAAPVEAFRHGDPLRDDYLTDGTVYLYPEGRFEPAAIFPLNEPQVAERGVYHWIIESPAYVSIDSGTLVILEDGAAAKTMIWPVVPACEVVLDDAPAWRGVDRLDLVSPTYGSTYPTAPARRRRLNVPAGEDPVAYTIGARGLIAIGRLSGCSPGVTRKLSPPSPPASDQQDLMVHLELPEAATPDARPEPASTRDERAPPQVSFVHRGSAVSPSAVVRTARRVSYFFLGLPAEAPGRLVVAHPAFRSVEVPVPPQGGSARELPRIQLAQRLDLTLDLEYRPRRTHERATIEALYCGRSRHLPNRSLDDCRPAASLPLVEGDRRYTFSGLDDGLYILTAHIDDELVHGLGSSAFPFLDPEAAHPPPVARYSLVEEEIFGNVLHKGEPVHGELRLEPTVASWPERRAATGPDLLYRLHYFGHLPYGPFRRDGDGELDPAETRGLHYFYRFAACDDDGRCRRLHPESMLRGSGRLDLEIGEGADLKVEVVDAADDSPIGGAKVGVPAPDARLAFDRGEVDWLEDRPPRTISLVSDAAGSVVFSALGPGRTPVEVRKEGYATTGTWVQLVEGETESIRLAVSREAPAASALQLVVGDGTPLARAALLGYGGEDGGLSCVVGTDAEGRLPELPPSCREAARFVVVHPHAALAAISAGQVLAGVDRLEVPPSPERAVRLRVTDAAGRPAVGAAVELRFRGFTLGEDDLLAALTRTGGYIPFRRTDERGELSLQGVDPDIGEPPEIALPLSRVEPVPLRGFHAGDTVSLVVED